MKKSGCLVFVVAVALAGCKGKDADKQSAAPAKLTASEVVDKKDSLKGSDVVISGTVRDARDSGGTYLVTLDAGTDRSVDLEFADKGAAAKAKGVTKGASVTAKCNVIGFGGGMGMVTVMTRECALQ